MMEQNFNYGPNWFMQFLWKFGILWLNKKVLMHDAERDYALFTLIIKEKDGVGQFLKFISFGSWTTDQVRWVLTQHLLPEEASAARNKDVPL